jgi:hypothetical protein
MIACGPGFTGGKVVVVAPEDWAGFFVAPEVLDKDGLTVDMAKVKAYKGSKPPITSWQGLEVKTLANVYQGKAYPSILRDNVNYLGGRIIGSPDCGWTKEVVGRYFAISDPSECITPKDGSAGYAQPDPKRNVYRWYLIREFTENPDGSKCLRIERIRWPAVNAGAPLLYDGNNYTKDGHVKPLSYIIAPGAFVTDVSEGWVDRYWSSPGDPRKIKISVSPDKGTKYDFETGDPIELGIGADPANPNGLRVRFHNQVPSTMEDNCVALMNLSRVAMNSAVGIGGNTFSLEDVQRQKDKQPSFLAGIRIGSATMHNFESAPTRFLMGVAGGESPEMQPGMRRFTRAPIMQSLVTLLCHFRKMGGNGRMRMPLWRQCCGGNNKPEFE